MKKASINKRNAAYWERRAAARMVDYVAEAEKTASDLGQAYYAANESMKDDMHRIFGSFQRAFEVSEAEAKRIFASVGNESATKALRDAAGKIVDPDQRQLALDALTSAPAYTWRIARLDDMLGNVSRTCNRLYKTDLKKTTDFLGEITGTAYNRAVYDLQVGTGTVGASFDLLPESRIKKILETNWSGKHYSARIYADVKDMESKLKQTLLESMFTGESEHKIAEKVAERWQIGYNDARRLIRTETNYVSNQAELESYRSAGVKEYIFTAVLDSRTSEICQELDGKKFPVDKAKVGVNLPPMHPYCRSTTIAEIEDDIWEMSDEEIRKILDETDEEIGLNEDVPFEEWFAGLKETGDGKVKYVGVDKSAGSGIIDLEGNFDSKGENGILKLTSKFGDSSDRLFRFADKIRPIDGFGDIVCHGSSEDFIIYGLNGEEWSYNAKEAAEMIRNSSEFHGQDIRLIVCQAGAGGKNSIAQLIADELGVCIMASTEMVNVDPEGNLFLSDNNDLAWLWYNGEDVKPTGKWVIFKPRK